MVAEGKSLFFFQNLQFSQKSDKSLGYSAYMMANPPMKNVMRFFFFNVTNPDEMIYEGAKPRLVETKAYAVIESEQKRYLRWSDDGDQIFYQNYKKYIISDEYTCPECSWDDIVTIPNPTGIGAAANIYDPQYNITPIAQKILAFGLLLVGEYPFVSHSVKEILFDGYNDALLTIGHSKIVAFLSGILNGGKSIIPIPIPDMPRLGFFQGYNNSRDEEYWIRSGKNDINRLGEIVTWANQTSLPQSWWPTAYSRSIRGSDSGSFCKMHLNKGDELPFFQSFMCRSFTKTFLAETVVHGIPSYTFSVPYEDYDTTSDVNIGFRYRNIEKVNYYPDWPSCPDRNPSKCVDPHTVNCASQKNLCHNCCNMSYVDGTYLVPPGIFPLVCYPGRLQPTPFAVMYSPPHFLYSPPQMINSVVGLNPNNETHRPMVYSHEPYSGAVTEVFYRLQVSMPVMKSRGVLQNRDITESIIPMFWEDSHAVLFDYTYDKIWLGFVLVPKLVDGIKYSLAALGVVLLLLVAMFQFRRRRNTKFEPADEPERF
ncbi:CD36 family protein [Ancylostoma ceylanicum]|uniref:CD36 family protein n=1 Tax=Ancylostoma ceylanicum TaxID=53326 RepID=A0A0D6LLT7_9BILA|nr:CD36 family protein [Ancylostoma ceylanicum]